MCYFLDMPKRAAVYARLSKDTEESVSIERQIASCRKYAEARGWSVVFTATDDISATTHRPEARDGWRSVLDAAGSYDLVIVWKIDRLARRVLDFLNADTDLQARGAALVAVEDPIDMSTPQGRAFAVMLSVFAELEAASIGARIRDARPVVLRQGRAMGRVPWPFESVPNPLGPGKVWRPIPDRAAAIRDGARRLVARQVAVKALSKEWRVLGFTGTSTRVRELMRSPVLYGATVYRGDVLRDAYGVQIVDEARAILTFSEWSELQDVFGSRPGMAAPSEALLLHGIAICATCGHRLGAYRAKSQGLSYSCRWHLCPAPVRISAALLDVHVLAEFVERAPTVSVFAWAGTVDTSTLDALREALSATQEALLQAVDEQTEAHLLARRRALRADIEATSQVMPTPEVVDGVSMLDVWDALPEDVPTAERTRILSDTLASVAVARGRGLDRVTITVR
jgi:DNA invertase Pin-like site-specific DNA recombinase